MELEKKTKNGGNPCVACSIEKECCRKLRFLRLTEFEYLQHFAKHLDKIIVQNHDETYLISSKEGQACPNWINNSCLIYGCRPVECRLFPHTMGGISKDNNYILINYHERTHCPQKKRLLLSDKEVKRLLLSFAHEAFGNSCVVKVKGESLLARWGSN
jgi:Fe-S-cluster containining protein